MNKFMNFLENMINEEGEVEPGATKSLTNVSSPSAKLSGNIKVDAFTDDDKEKSKKIDALISANKIKMDKHQVETLIALVNKTLADWNRTAEEDTKEIKTIISQSINNNIITTK